MMDSRQISISKQCFMIFYDYISYVCTFRLDCMLKFCFVTGEYLHDRILI